MKKNLLNYLITIFYVILICSIVFFSYVGVNLHKLSSSSKELLEQTAELHEQTAELQNKLDNLKSIIEEEHEFLESLLELY